MKTEEELKSEEVTEKIEINLYCFQDEKTGKGTILQFKSDLINISITGKKGYIYTLCVKNVFDFGNCVEEDGYIILDMEVSQYKIGEKIIKSLRMKCTDTTIENSHHDFQKIIWPEDFFGQTYQIRIIKKKP